MKPQYERIADLIFAKYGEKPDFPWREYPDYEVFRHRDNRKWFGLVMNIPPDRLHPKDPAHGLRLPAPIGEKKEIHILDLKVRHDEIGALENREGIFPAYHMNAGTGYPCCSRMCSLMISSWSSWQRATPSPNKENTHAAGLARAMSLAWT